ncbi:hypothetical protein BH18ACT15_BH18ACT15_01960 [soil metagenome]
MRPRPFPFVLVAASLLTVAFSPPDPGASSRPLSSVAARAQDVAQRVTSLERDVARLTSVERRLAAGVAAASQRLASRRLALARAEKRRRGTEDELVARAVEAYKSPPGAALGVLLGSRSMGDVAALQAVTSAAALANEKVLHSVLVARRHAERESAAAEQRKAELLARQERMARVRTAKADTLAQRRTALGRLSARISELQRAAKIEERRARRQLMETAGAAGAPGSTPIPAGPGGGIAEPAYGLGPATDLPAGFLHTAVSFEGLASWYGPGFAVQSTANGDIFDPRKFTAASKTLPLPTWLYVTRGGRGTVVLVNDRGPYAGDRVLDLSKAAAQALGVTGVSWVRAEVLVKRAG